MKPTTVYTLGLVIVLLAATALPVGAQGGAPQPELVDSGPRGDPRSGAVHEDARSDARGLRSSNGPAEDGASTPAGAPRHNAVNRTLDATILYVDKDATGANNGTSWADAFVTLQAALAVTHANPANTYEIWVAAGVYYPDEGGAHVNNDRNETFRIARNNVQLYGGFAGGEAARSARDWTANPTILSGDIDGNDTTEAGVVANPFVGIQGSNAYHVVWFDGVDNEGISNNTVLDGFTLTAGNADSSTFPNGHGGGLYCRGRGTAHACSPILGHVTFRGNKAGWGGGMYNDGEIGGVSSPALTDVTFRDNFAPTSGGGLYNDGTGGQSSPTLTDVTFTANTASWGGGMYNDGLSGGQSNPTLLRVAFNNNIATSAYGSGGFGGAMFNDGYGGASSPTLTNVTFSANSAGQAGGGMYNNGRQNSGQGESSPTLTDVTFTSNSAGWGGGMYNDGYGGVSSPTLTRVTFDSNTASSSGGGMRSNGSGGVSSPVLTDSVFRANRASWGGGMYNDGSGGVSSPSLTRVRFADNRADDSSGGGVGGAMFNDGESAGVSSPTLVNVAFQRNWAMACGGMHNDGYGGASSPTLTHVTLSNNIGVNLGGGMCNDGRLSGASAPALTNCLLWGNDTAGSDPQIFNNAAAPTLAYTLIQGGCPAGATCGAGMLDADPLFAADGYHITGPSPALDAGTAAGVTSDLDNDVRPVGDPLDPPDLGADEFKELSLTRPAAGTMTFGAARAKVVFGGGAPAGLANVTISVTPGQHPTTNPADPLVQRKIILTPSAAVAFNAALSLGYAEAELNGLAEASLGLYRWDGASWQPHGGAPDAANNFVTADVTGFSPWAIGLSTSTPTALGLASFTAQTPPLWPYAAAGLLLALGALVAAAAFWFLPRRRAVH